MIVKLLTEHHLEFLSLKRRLQMLVRVYRCRNATLLEIPCHGSNLMSYHARIQRGRGLHGVRTPPLLENLKDIGFLMNTGPDCLENYKATQPTFHVGQPPMMVHISIFKNNLIP